MFNRDIITKANIFVDSTVTDIDEGFLFSSIVSLYMHASRAIMFCSFKYNFHIHTERDLVADPARSNHNQFVFVYNQFVALHALMVAYN